MAVLSRELDSYQRAVDAYQRQVDRHNRKAARYDDTLVRDAAGNILVLDASGNVMKVDSEGRVTPGALPSGSVQDYGVSAIPDESRFRALRQGAPVDTRRETRTDVRYIPGFSDESGSQEGYYYTLGADQGEGTRAIDRLGPEWRVEQRIPGNYVGAGEASYAMPDAYEVSRDVSVYPERPPEWDKEFNRRAPDPTFGAAKRAGMPSAAQIERGLIAEVLRGKGVRSGAPNYGPPGRSAAPQATTDRRQTLPITPGSQVYATK